MPASDTVIADLFDLGGAGLSVTDVGGGPPAPAPGLVRIGVSRGRPPAFRDSAGWDILLTDEAAAAAPWVSVDDLDGALARLAAVVSAQPVAAAVAAQVIRAGVRLDLDDALAMESLAYSMLLASGGFRAWRAANPARHRPDDPSSRVRIEETDGALVLTLDRPAAHNAVDARMRDALCEALAFAGEHPDAPPVILRGEGPSFCAGGDLDEFGTADDPGQAHMIRSLRSAARLAAALGDRLTVRIHGACVGAGIEVPAAAARVVARRGAVLRLPEVGMGLIPGAGGAATIPRRIGRHRACWLAISGVDLDVTTARAWGLLDEIVP